MDADHLAKLATLRILVGYLGEREHFAWWQSAFFAPGSQAFLAPLFARTRLLAQCNGVTRAASLTHDERIGVGNVYHLFRLPEDIEQGIHRALQDADLCAQITSMIESKDVALAHLHEPGGAKDRQSAGPVRVGRASDLRTAEGIHLLAMCYHNGFVAGVPSYPFFSGERI